MVDVLWNLEYSLQLKETTMLDDPNEISANHLSEIPLRFSEEENFGDNTIERRSDVVSEEGS